ncbi:hypothetical protein Tco_1125572 [Tanacetum coccineum]|uniref:Peptidase A2 domain-containing protein n=1 Tax=Tanacetum coccineum TaxID=301880 RepID=A0ABQ5J9C0_9ASTR
MDTLSLVSKYLNGLEDYLDDGDSLEARKLTVRKSKEELKLFDALEHKSVIVKEGSHRVVVFKKEPSRAYSKPFTRFSLPCDVDGQGAWDAELDMADSFNYITEKRFDMLGFVRVDYGNYGRKMVKEVRVEIHGFSFLVNFVVIGYANEGEPSVIFGRDLLVTSKNRVDFRIGSSNGELVKIGKASRNKSHNVNKLTPPPQLRIKEIPPISSIAPPPPIYHPFTKKQKEKVKEALDRKYKELEESKPILEVLENYMTYHKKLDEVMMGRARLSSDEYGEEENIRIVEHGLPKKMCDPSNFMLPVRVNGTVEMSALVDTGANIPVDKELTLLLGRPFLRTCGAIIDKGRSTLCIDDGVTHHTYFPKARAKAYMDNFELDEEDDWMSCFEVGHDEDGNPKYGPVAPSFLDIKDDIERALAMEAYFNPFKNIIVFKKLVGFLGSLPVQLKNIDWGNEGHGVYKKVEGDGAWHANFELITLSGRKFTREFKTKETKRKLSGKFTSEDILKFDHFLD